MSNDTLFHKIIVVCDGREPNGPHSYRVLIDNLKEFSENCDCKFCEERRLQSKAAEEFMRDIERKLLYGDDTPSSEG